MKPMLFRFQTIMHNSAFIEARVQHNLMVKVDGVILKCITPILKIILLIYPICNCTDLYINIYKALQSSTAEANASS